MTPLDLKEETRREWQDLGFYYDRDDADRLWRIVGSTLGLVRFAECIRAYAAGPNSKQVSEHEQYGPYMYLEIGTWTEPVISDHWIAGPPEHLFLLATLVEETASKISPGESHSIGRHWTPKANFDLVLEARADDFDPASEDPQCK